jgi:dihydroorotase
MLLLGLSAVQTGSTATYDLLLKGGHVIDARNGVNAIRDVAIKDGKIAATRQRSIPPRQ